MFNISQEFTSGDNQVIRAVSGDTLEIVVLNYVFEAASGDPVMQIHGLPAGQSGDAFPIFADAKSGSANFDGGQDPLPNDAYMGGLRVGPNRDLAVTVKGGGKIRLTLWGYEVHAAGKQKWNDKGDAPEA